MIRPFANKGYILSNRAMEKIKTEMGKTFTIPCVVCSAVDTRFLCKVDGNNIWHCPECVSDFVWPMPDKQSLKALYDRQEWFEGGERGGYEHYDEQTESLPQFLEEAFGVIEVGGPPMTVLDIGCGYGNHLAKAAEKGWQCFGVEVSEHARETAKERYGDSIYLMARIEELVPCQFDLVLMLDVIEHLTDPYPLFYALFSAGAIGPQTKIIITTPNARSFDAVADPSNWVYRHPPSHLIYYSAKSLNTLLNRLKWNEVKIDGLYSLSGDPQEPHNEPSSLNKKFERYAGLLCIAKGSNFVEFMHERYVPGTWNKIAEYEHIPRYVMAQKLANGLNVLDFGCGTGYGTAMLAKEAKSVIGVDISEKALQWAKHHHRNVRLHFERRDDLGAGLSENSFDLITCFEMIEHVSAETQELAIKNFRRLLGARGKLVVSTPNPKVTENYGENPYHLHEMSEDEFVGLLRRYFKYVQVLRQWIRPSVLIADRSLFSKKKEVLACSLGINGTSNDLPAVAYIAICCDTPFEDVDDICNFDDSFDFVAKSIADINMLNRERIDKASLFQQVRNNKFTIRNLEKNIRNLEKNNALLEHHVEMLRSELSDRETQLDAFRQSRLSELLYILQNETRFLKKLIKGFIIFVKIYTPPAILNKLSLCKRAFQREYKGKETSDKAISAYKVRCLFPVQKNRPKVIHALANFMIGGSSRLVVDLIEHLGHRYDQEVVTSYNPDPPAYVGLTIHEFPDRSCPDDLLKFFKEVRPQLVHIHYWGDIDMAWYEQVFTAAENCDCELIENINTPVKPFFSDRISKYVFVSNYVLQTFAESSEKVSTIYPGSNFDIFKRDMKNKVPDDCIGMVYRLEPDKLNKQAIDVFVEVVRRRPATKVLIVGGGTFLEPYKQAARKASVLDALNFTGFVPYEDLPALYNQMSIFVAPVWKESFGQVSPFAMSMGIPVVGYDVGALSEILGDKSLLAPPGDSSCLADIIIELLDDRERRIKIGAKNRERAHENFSVEAMVEGYKNLYEKLIGGEK